MRAGRAIFGARLALLLFAAAAAAQQPAGDKIRGFDLETLALATAKATAFSTQYGTAQGAESFDGWLRQQGLSLTDYDQAYDLFLKRFEEDRTGRLEESYFAALDRFAPLAGQPAAPAERTAAELMAGDASPQIDAAYLANAWPAAQGAPTGPADVALQAQRIGQLLADNEARTQATLRTLQDASSRQIAEKMAGLRPGTLPPADDGKAPVARPRPAPLQPGSLEALHSALQSADAETRRGAARGFAFECDGLALSAREGDPRAPFCQGEVLRDVWLPAVWEILDAAPQEELRRVAPLLPYLESFGFAEPSRLALEALRERLQDAELAAATELAAAASAPEKILLGARRSTLREVLAAVEKSLGL